MIAIVDMGNRVNVKNAFARIGAQVAVTRKKSVLKTADAIVLPGVGAFGAGMKRLERKRTILADLVDGGTPFLGICLGMQLLFETSEESSGVRGLGILKGSVRRLSASANLIVPHMGWNKVENTRGPLFDGMDNFYAYFVHSYYGVPKDSSVVAGTTRYGTLFPSALAGKNLFATQFHPEKSGKTGIVILRNFIQEVKR